MIDRQQLIHLAQQAGYSIQYNLSEDGSWVEQLWGGESETRKAEAFAKLIISHTKAEKALK